MSLSASLGEPPNGPHGDHAVVRQDQDRRRRDQDGGFASLDAAILLRRRRKIAGGAAPKTGSQQQVTLGRVAAACAQRPTSLPARHPLPRDLQ